MSLWVPLTSIRSPAEVVGWAEAGGPASWISLTMNTETR